MTDRLPLVSVVMPVYNAERYLRESIDSILNQTFRNFEFLIIDDGSTDLSLQILQQYEQSDNRIRLYHRENKGVVDTLNEGVTFAQGKYIVRMDADDISLAHRLMHQVEFMEANPQIGISGSWVQLFGEKNEIWHHRRENNHIRNMLLFKTSGFSHSTVIARRDLLQAFPYDHQYPHLEDTGCWVNIALNSSVEFANIPEVLVHYRVHDEQVSECFKEAQNNSYQRLIHAYLSGLGVELSQEEMHYHMALCEHRAMRSLEEVSLVGKNLLRMGNAIEDVLPDDFHLFKERWLGFCLANRHLLNIKRCYDSISFPSDDVCFVKEALFHEGEC